MSIPEELCIIQDIYLEWGHYYAEQVLFYAADNDIALSVSVSQLLEKFPVIMKEKEEFSHA